MDFNLNRRTEVIAVSLLLIVFFIVAVTSLAEKSAVIDEVAHLPAGYTYLTKFDYRLNVEHPPLVKLLAGFPLLFVDINEPVDPELFERSYEWDYGSEFLYSVNDADLLLWLGRIPMILLGVLGGLFVYLWAKKLYGKKAALFALFLFTFSPNMLAHTRIIQTDMATATFLVMTLYFFWKFLKQTGPTDSTPTNKNKYLIYTAIALGLGLSAKFSGLFFIPILGILFGLNVLFEDYVHIKNKELMKPLKKSLKYAGYLLIMLLIAFFIVLLFYGFKNFGYYMEGFSKVSSHSTIGHPSFLMGEHSTQGWWYYFIIAFLIKTPIPTLIFLAIALIFSLRKLFKERFADEYFLLIPILVYFIAFMLNNINIGLRHILPIYPLIFILISRIITLKLKPDIADKVYKGMIALLCIWYLISTIIIFPHFLAFFNGFVGGPDNGHNYLIDSNIDWGQDLKGLNKWIYDNNLEGTELRLSYLGNEPLNYRGLTFTDTTCYPVNGLTIVSVNALHDIANKNQDCLKWLADYEPKEKIGYSIFIYDISDQKIINYQKTCEMKCPDICEAQDKVSKGAIADSYREKCMCDCE